MLPSVKAYYGTVTYTNDTYLYYSQHAGHSGLYRIMPDNSTISVLSNLDFLDIRYENDIWVACTTKAILYSNDAETWLTGFSLDFTAKNRGYLMYNDGVWVATYTYTSNNCCSYYSTDGTTWNPVSWLLKGDSSVPSITNVACHADRFIAATTNGIFYYDHTTESDPHWMYSNIDSGKITDCWFTHEKYFAFAYDTNQLYYSDDGVTWGTTYFSDHLDSRTSIYAEGWYIISDTDGRMYFSSDGQSWMYVYRFPCLYSSCVYADGKIVWAPNGSGSIFYSDRQTRAYVTPDDLEGEVREKLNALTLTSPSGTKYTLAVDDEGNLATADENGNQTTTGESVYELIESITLDEDVQSVVRTAEPDGTAYNFRALYIKLTSPVYSEARRLYFSVGNTDSTDVWEQDRLTYVSSSSIINTNGHATELFVERVHGIFRSQYIQPDYVSATLGIYTNHADVRTGAIKAVRIFAYNNDTNLIPSETTIEVWGVRE